MNGAEHYIEAERLLDRESAMREYNQVRELHGADAARDAVTCRVAEGQAHATLALAGATAILNGLAWHDHSAAAAWRGALGIAAPPSHEDHG